MLFKGHVLNVFHVPSHYCILLTINIGKEVQLYLDKIPSGHNGGFDHANILSEFSYDMCHDTYKF